MIILRMAVIFVFVSGCVRGEPQPGAAVATMRGSDQVQRSQKELILDAVLDDLANNPDLKSTREFYGTDGEKHLVLIDGPESVNSWPADYQPVLPGWTVTRSPEGREKDLHSTRRLGVRIDQYSVESPAPVKIFNSPIEVTVLNAGGSENGFVIGGCTVFYRPVIVNGKWVVQFEGSFDP